MNLRIAFFGSPAFSVPVIESLYDAFNIVLVVSQPNKPVGRGLRLSPSPVSNFAITRQLPLCRPQRLNDPAFRQMIAETSVDVAIVAAYGKILPTWLLEWPRCGMINVHASLLPKYRGASPIQASLLAGDAETGITYMVMNERMDEGDVLRQSVIQIARDETTATLTEKLAQLASQEISEVVRQYVAGSLHPRPQDHNQASYSQLLSKHDGYINFSQPPADLERRIRALHPWPGVWGEWRGRRIKLLPENMILMEGKRPTSLADFLQGHPDFPLKQIN